LKRGLGMNVRSHTNPPQQKLLGWHPLKQASTR